MTSNGVLRVAEDLLRRRKEVFANIKTGQNLNRFLLNAKLCTILFAAAIYGQRWERTLEGFRFSTASSRYHF